ncbi:MAG: tRNA (adenosine(37)-N6)-dimethylallyltransferase MiaA [candidate division FCPU426 bacterium]
MTAAERLLVVICGPTASGKSGVSFEMAAAFPLRLLSADSMQVYRGMDIGTAKPLLPQRAEVGLLDLVDPGEAFSAGRFAAEAANLAETAWLRGQTPCFVGGSGLYLDAVLHGLSEMPKIPAAVRQEVSQTPLPDLLSELRSSDPAGAEKLDQKNPRRVQRAVEVLRASGKPLSLWQAAPKTGMLRPNRILMLGMDPGRTELARAIRERNRHAMESGWIDETKRLAEVFGEEKVRSTGAIGYSELLDVLAGRQDFETARGAIEIATAQYARRQRTWFRKDATIEWFVPADKGGILKRIGEFLNAK